MDDGLPWTPEQTADTAALTAGATAILLGRTTYEMFAPAWSQRTAEEDPGAPFFNDTHKYVVSSTLTEPSWGPATVLAYDAGPDRAAQGRGRRATSTSAAAPRWSGRCSPTGSSTSCTSSSTRCGSGRGPYLRPHGQRPQTTLALLGSTAYENGVVHLVYGPALPAAEGTRAD